MCGLEFNYDSPAEDEDEEQSANANENENDDDSNNRSNDQVDDTISLLRGELPDSELLYNDQIFRQLFLYFEVQTEKGR